MFKILIELLAKADCTPAERMDYARMLYDEAQRTLKIGTQMLELPRLNSTERVERGDTFRADEQIRNILLAMQNE